MKYWTEIIYFLEQQNQKDGTNNRSKTTDKYLKFLQVVLLEKKTSLSKIVPKRNWMQLEAFKRTQLKVIKTDC